MNTVCRNPMTCINFVGYGALDVPLVKPLCHFRDISPFRCDKLCNTKFAVKGKEEQRYAVKDEFLLPFTLTKKGR